jgi:hypothetical protein
MVVFACASLAQPSPYSSDDYLGQKPPGETPEIFSPGLVCLPNRWETSIVFSPAGDECFITVTEADYANPRVFSIRRLEGKWQPEEPAPFTAGHPFSAEVSFSSDGRKVFFTAEGASSAPGATRDFWVSERTPLGWSPAVPVATPINSEFGEFCLTTTRDGTAYFVSDRPGGLGRFDLYRTQHPTGQPLTVENLGAPLNSAGNEWDPCPAPDGRFLVFASGRKGGHGKTDLYVTFADGNGGWTTPVNLGGGISTADDEFQPRLSPDGKHLFFARRSGPECDLYWVSATVIEKTRPTTAP